MMPGSKLPRRHDEETEGLDLPTDGPIVAFTAEERPDLWEDARSLFQDVWPEYNNHGNDSGSYFGALFPKYAYLQILFFDRETEQVVVRGRTIPFRWDGSLDDLPNGIDAVGYEPSRVRKRRPRSQHWRLRLPPTTKDEA